MNSKKLDYTLILFNDLSSSSDKFVEMVLACDEFDEQLPEFMKFAQKNNVVFKAR